MLVDACLSIAIVSCTNYGCNFVHTNDYAFYMHVLMQVVKNRFDGDVGKCPLEFSADSLTLSGYLKEKQQLQTKSRLSEHSPRTLKVESSETAKSTVHQSTGAKHWQVKRSGAKGHVSVDSKKTALQSLSQRSKKLKISKPMESTSHTHLTPLSVNATPRSVSSDSSTASTGMDSEVNSDSTVDDCAIDGSSEEGLKLPLFPSNDSDALLSSENEMKQRSYNLNEASDVTSAESISACHSDDMQHICWHDNSELCSQCDH